MTTNPLTLDEQQVLWIFTGLSPEELDKQLAQLSTVEVLAEASKRHFQLRYNETKTETKTGYLDRGI